MPLDPVSALTVAIVPRLICTTLLDEFGEHGLLGYVATRRDKMNLWDTGEVATARAGIAHRAVGSISFASGNPVGDPERWPQAIEAWRRGLPIRETILFPLVRPTGR